MQQLIEVFRVLLRQKLVALGLCLKTAANRFEIFIINPYMYSTQELTENILFLLSFSILLGNTAVAATGPGGLLGEGKEKASAAVGQQAKYRANLGGSAIPVF